MDLPSYTPRDAAVPEGTTVLERGSTPQQIGPRLNRTAADVVRFLLQNGEMVTEGDVIVVGDVAQQEPTEVAYEVLCRQHHRRKMTAARARAVSMISEPLPFQS